MAERTLGCLLPQSPGARPRAPRGVCTVPRADGRHTFSSIKVVVNIQGFARCRQVIWMPRQKIPINAIFVKYVFLFSKFSDPKQKINGQWFFFFLSPNKVSSTALALSQETLEWMIWSAGKLAWTSVTVLTASVDLAVPAGWVWPRVLS